ncbi:MAG: hypothetical protein AVDCRST_MAG02-650 [uncultured Rubrobacteraceae bacterium]|uniref:Uncharacterized protein n=1 Tax=uncultured Rubrobacteraceae bacterium TaxID=349277 RepID=A0A6J4QRL9_9ACTN|nr:MAG: hypothetical protein AVDCRST_MAG02-650 [uncultured Rubrobacteraceae bacterium]
MPARSQGTGGLGDARGGVGEQDGQAREHERPADKRRGDEGAAGARGREGISSGEESPQGAEDGAYRHEQQEPGQGRPERHLQARGSRQRQVGARPHEHGRKQGYRGVGQGDQRALPPPGPRRCPARGDQPTHEEADDGAEEEQAPRAAPRPVAEEGDPQRDVRERPTDHRDAGQVRRVLEADRNAVRQQPQVPQGHREQREHGADRPEHLAYGSTSEARPRQRLGRLPGRLRRAGALREPHHYGEHERDGEGNAHGPEGAAEDLAGPSREQGTPGRPPPRSPTRAPPTGSRAGRQRPGRGRSGP